MKNFKKGEPFTRKNYYCSICEREIERNNRLVYQKYSKTKSGTYNSFINKKTLDFCDECFEMVKNLINLESDDFIDT